MSALSQFNPSEPGGGCGKQTVDGQHAPHEQAQALKLRWRMVGG
jgi:hypothetical protein